MNITNKKCTCLDCRTITARYRIGRDQNGHPVKKIHQGNRPSYCGVCCQKRVQRLKRSRGIK